MPRNVEVTIPIGHGSQTVRVPNLVAVAKPEYTPGVADKRAEIARALREPIGTPRLVDLAKRRRDAVIVVNDITRPYPGGEMVLELAKELNVAGLSDDRITLLVAYGNHRANTPEELETMFGAEVVKRFKFVHHIAVDPKRNVTVGCTAGGVEVSIDRAFAEADLKILTGCIAPHQFAGFSGGRKSVIPGIAGLAAIKRHHSFPIRPEAISLGRLEGNCFHEEAVAAAKLAKVDFIVNAVENPQRELVRCVAGDLEKAFYVGVEVSRKLWTVAIPERPQIAIVSPGGYPRDFDLHQSQKPLGCVEMVCPTGSAVILCAECPDGAGKPGKILKDAPDLQTVIDRFLAEGFAPNGNGKAYMLARAIKRFRIVLAGSKIPADELREMFLDGYPTVQEALDAMLQIYGADAPILVIPNAAEIIPIVVG